MYLSYKIPPLLISSVYDLHTFYSTNEIILSAMFIRKYFTILRRRQELRNFPFVFFLSEKSSNFRTTLIPQQKEVYKELLSHTRTSIDNHALSAPSPRKISVARVMQDIPESLLVVSRRKVPCPRRKSQAFFDIGIRTNFK